MSILVQTAVKPVENLVKFSTNELKIGMYVSEIDIGWHGSGFILQGFQIDERLLNHLKIKCKWVIVSKKHSISGLFSDEIDVAWSNQSKKRTTLISWLMQLFWNVEKGSPNFQHTVLSNDKTDLLIKQDLLFSNKAVRARKKFQSDPLVSKVLTPHVTSLPLSSEYKKAIPTKEKIFTLMRSSLLHDFNNSESMDLIVLDTKNAVTDIVLSMLNNPDAIRLVESIKQYDNYSYTHAVDVCIMMIAFGRELCLPKEDLIDLGLGGLLHDIGEIKPTESNKVNFKNVAMYHIYRSHVVDGLKLLQNTNYSNIVKTIIAQHHEKFDGSGYPYGLKDTEISMYGKMIAIVDSYVSFVAGRSVESPLIPSAAMSYLINNAGKLYDPVLCDIFAQVVGVYPVGTYVELNTKEIAFVIQQNRAWRLKPIIQVITDNDKKKITPYLLNLMSTSASGKSISKEVVKFRH